MENTREHHNYRLWIYDDLCGTPFAVSMGSFDVFCSPAISWSLSQTKSIMLQKTLAARVSCTTATQLLQLRKTMKYGGSSNGAQGANAPQILLTRLPLLSISGLFFAN